MKNKINELITYKQALLFKCCRLCSKWKNCNNKCSVLEYGEFEFCAMGDCPDCGSFKQNKKLVTKKEIIKYVSDNIRKNN